MAKAKKKDRLPDEKQFYTSKQIMLAFAVAIALGFITSLSADMIGKLIADTTKRSPMWVTILVQLCVVIVMIVATFLVLEFGVRRPLNL